MRNLLIAIAFLFVSTLAFAVMRQAPTTFGAVADGVVITGKTILIDANIYYTGLTVGNMIQLKEGLTSAGSTFCTIVADTANGNKKCSYPEGFVVDTGIYVDVTLSGGVAGMNLMYQ